MKINTNLAQARIDRAIKEEGDYYATHPSMVERFISRVSDKYELGKINVPIDVFIKLADYYTVSIDYLVGRGKK